jgi:hypothetical protein
MAHFAEINSSDNKVVRVIVVSNEDVNANGGDQSTQAETFVKNLLGTGDNTYWKQTSYNNNFRVNMATKDGFYKPAEDIFHAPAPEWSSWVLNNTNWQWEPPLSYPGDTRPFDGSVEEWSCLWDEDLWVSSSNTNGWTSMQSDDVPSRDTNKYFLDQSNLTWSVLND